MADGFIVRRGGAGVERTVSPSINFVSKSADEIVVTFTNNDATEAELYYGLTSPLTDTVTLATGATSSNITFSGLAQDTQFTVSAYALVTDPTTKKIKSEVISTNITTDTAVYTAATGGTTEEYNDGGKRYKSHTFTSDDDFEVTTVGDAIDDRNKVDYLIIAGGGSGGFEPGGGGAGGYRTTLGTSGGGASAESKKTVTAQTYGIVVGAGGAATTSSAIGNNGTNSSALSESSTGGGGGGRDGINSGVGEVGGSGGGGAVGITTVASGTTDEGFAGGQGFGEVPGSTIVWAGGGGGGAAEAGKKYVDSPLETADGGDGLANLLRTGSNETRGGGGGGGGRNNGNTTRSFGGAGGGGRGGHRNNVGTSGAGSIAENGVVNTGGGGGGGVNPDGGGQGGAGIVIIRYEIAPSV